MTDAAIIDEETVEKGWDAGNNFARVIVKETNQMLDQMMEESIFKCSFILGFLDTFSAIRDNLDIDIGEPLEL